MGSGRREHREAAGTRKGKGTLALATMTAKTTELVSQVSTTAAETRIDIDSDHIRPVPANDPFPHASTPSALGTHSVLATPSYVASLEFSIQRGFRIKLFTLLLMQLALTMGVATVARFALPIEVIFPAQSYGTLGLCFACLVSLPMLTYVRDRHPWNLVLTAIWSVAWGVFMAAAHVDGGMVKSYVLFTIFGSLCVGVFFLLLFSCISYTDEYTGERKLISCASAGAFACACSLFQPADPSPCPVRERRRPLTRPLPMCSRRAQTSSCLLQP